MAHGFSSFGSQALEQELNSCWTWAWLLHSMWDLPGPGIEPMSLALAVRFFPTEPPGKPFCPYLSPFWNLEARDVSPQADQPHISSWLHPGRNWSLTASQTKSPKSFFFWYLCIWLCRVLVVACTRALSSCARGLHSAVSAAVVPRLGCPVAHGILVPGPGI